MDFGLAFSFPFKDTDWLKKMAITGLIGLIPIAGSLYILGWMLEIIRRVITDQPDLLPRDVDFGGFIVRGLQGLVISIVYSLPAMIITLPVAIIPIIGQTAGMDEQTLTTLTLVFNLCCNGIAFIYYIFEGLMLPAAYASFVRTNSLGAAFRIGEVFGLVKAAIGAYFLALLGSILAGIVAMLGIIACGIGLLVTIPYGQAIFAHFAGQAYKQASANLNIR